MCADDAGGAKLRLSEGGRIAPLPVGAPLMGLPDAAGYLRLSMPALRKLIEGRPDGSDGDLGDRLRSWLVALSPRRRYIKARPFMSWLRDIAGESAPAPTPAGQNTGPVAIRP
jgi:hypothetical protein